MRITGGILCRRIVEAPKGNAVRPTQDRVREALFSILGARVDGCRFLDGFAGSGAVGLEAWSRGAAAVCWVEANNRVFKTLKKNVTLFCDQGAEVVCRDAVRFLKQGVTEPFDIIFCDPPYERGKALDNDAPGWIETILAAVDAGGAVNEEGIVIIEVALENSSKAPEGWTLTDERVYGDTKLDFFVKGGELC